VFRLRRDIGRQSVLGLLATDRRGKGYSSTVLGADGQIQFGLADKVKLQFLHSRTVYPEAFAVGQMQPLGTFSGWAMSLAYYHEAKNWNWWAKYEDFGRDFRADVGFVPQVDLRLKEGGVRRIFWGDSKKRYRKWFITLKGSIIHDQSGYLTDQMFEASLDYNGPLQPVLSFGLVSARENWRATPFEQDCLRIESNIRPTGALLFSLAAKVGDAVDYEGSRPASIFLARPGLSWFLGRHLQLGFDHARECLRIEGEPLYRDGPAETAPVRPRGGRRADWSPPVRPPSPTAAAGG